MNRPHNILFSQKSLSQHLHNSPKAINGKIEGEARDYLLNVSETDYINHLINHFSITSLTLDIQKTEVSEQLEGYEKVSDFGEVFDVKRSYLKFAIPFTGEKELFEFQPNETSLSPPRAEIGKNEIYITIIDSGDPIKIRQELDNKVNHIEQYLSSQRRAISEWNQNIRSIAEAAFKARKEKLLKDSNVLNSLGFPLRKTGESSSYTIPVKKAISINRPSAPNTPYIPHPKLEESNYQEVLAALRHMAIVMEQSPSAFDRIDEEALRMHFLVQLNGSFKGEATGETFNYDGKTDILLRKDGKNVFIAECKFWGGPKVFTDTIDQLLNYLTWRDSKAAIIIFVRNTSIATVVNKIPELIKAHPSFQSEKPAPPSAMAGECRFLMKSSRDPSLSLDITIQIYDVPTNASQAGRKI